MTTFALLMSVSHLGKPMRFYRGFNNLRYSPMAREGLGLAMFSAGCGLTALFSLPSNTWVVAFVQKTIGLDLVSLSETLPVTGLMTGSGIFALLAGTGGLFYMNKCYQIKARPFWNHLQTATSFVGNSLSLGALVSGVIVIGTFLLQDTVQTTTINECIIIFAGVFTLGLIIEAIGLTIHNHQLNSSENEGGAAHYVQCTTFGKTYLLRNTLLGMNIIIATLLLVMHYLGTESSLLLLPWLALGLLNCFTAVIGRALFYILVIPTTMPGAFFWRNKSFEEHARDTGLANNPATGVAPLAH